MEDNFITALQALQARAVNTRTTLQTIINITEHNASDKPSHEKIIKRDIIGKSAIYISLLQISPSLANSYLQVKLDIEDESRSSWAGTAHEIREVLSTSLRLLAPDPKVISQTWYVQEPKTSGPTQKQRVRYILQQHNAGSKEREVAEQVVNLEEMVGNLTRATYSRASDAAHKFKNKKEVIRIIKYFDAFAHDLFNID